MLAGPRSDKPAEGGGHGPVEVYDWCLPPDDQGDTMALVLTRGVGERILIGDDIVIEVRAIVDGRHVRIAIEAPRQVPIHRSEVYDAVSAANAGPFSTSQRPAAPELKVSASTCTTI